MSRRSRLRLAGWTIFGTLGCVTVSVTFNYFAFRSLEDIAFFRAMVSAAILPIVLAGPLFFLLSMKLRELAIVNHRLAALASTDGLTACLTRRAFTELIDGRRHKPGRSAEESGALLLVDADHFKGINDRFGHETGDEALRIIADAIRSALRKDDAVGRLGGEEFGVFLPGASVENARDVAERIRKRVADMTFAPFGINCRLSVSVGGAAFLQRMAFAELFRIADRRLYEAKSAGRDRVNLAGIGPGDISATPVLH